jgi:hypothetical protein
MTREELDQLVEKCRELSPVLDYGSDYDYEKMIKKYPELERILISDDCEDSQQVDRFIEYLENNSSEFIDGNEGDYGYEKDAWDHFIEVEEESENWDPIYPNGDDDD